MKYVPIPQAGLTIINRIELYPFTLRPSSKQEISFELPLPENIAFVTTKASTIACRYWPEVTLPGNLFNFHAERKASSYKNLLSKNLVSKPNYVEQQAFSEALLVSLQSIDHLEPSGPAFIPYTMSLPRDSSFVTLFPNK